MNGNEVCVAVERDAASLDAFFRRNYSPANSGFNSTKDPVDESFHWGTLRGNRVAARGSSSPPSTSSLGSSRSVSQLLAVSSRVHGITELRHRCIKGEIDARQDGKRCTDTQYTGKINDSGPVSLALECIPVFIHHPARSGRHHSVRRLIIYHDESRVFRLTTAVPREKRVFHPTDPPAETQRALVNYPRLGYRELLVTDLSRRSNDN